jgi:hypothetical protein
MERRLQSRLHILGVPVAEINDLVAFSAASPDVAEASPGESSALAASEAPLLPPRMSVGPEPTVQILTSRMSSTTTHTPTGKLAAP